jgi:hypothetical protein
VDTTDRASSSEVRFVGQSAATWRYWVDQPLGTPGGFGGVYAAEGSDGTPMAVKVVKKQRPSGALGDRLLRREIDIGRRVRESGSDRLLPVLDAADHSDALLLVMARAGRALDAALPMSEPDVITVMTDITKGLQDLHAIGIIHRDLKPPNVLLHDSHWKLADFGIARDQEIGTQDPTFIGWGSLPYMAPELWELKSPTVKTDLYALGCLAFELLTGVAPYTGDQAALREAHLTRAPPDVPCSNITLKNLITRLIDKDPADRPQDARAVLDRLCRAVSTHSAAQEAIAHGLGVHYAEKSNAAAQAAAAVAAANTLRQQKAQALADLREISGDALEDLRAVEPEAQLREQVLASNTNPSDALSFTLSTTDVTLQIRIWKDQSDARTLFEKIFANPVNFSGIIFAAAAYIGNRRHPEQLNAANLVYEQSGGRFAWQVYKFRANAMVSPEKYDYGPHGRTHGLAPKDFFRERPSMRIRLSGEREPIWTLTEALLTADIFLELFQEAVDL